MHIPEFDNSFLNKLPGDSSSENFSRQVLKACWSKVAPTPVVNPKLLAYSKEVANLLDLSDELMASPALTQALAGNQLLQGMETYATCYGGHQFGHWSGQLGDGRAIFLGELLNRAGRRFELQLKGAGPTPYSRRADGRAVLRSSIREFLCSEAMHHLGVPTTRALSLLATGETVIRDMFYDGHPMAEQGAIVCRVAPSFTRFGHFEILAARGDFDLLKTLVSFTIARDFPELLANFKNRIADDVVDASLIKQWFIEICERTAVMIAHWMRVGFVHGVMNTDNMSILGLTIDYGPYGWVDSFDPGWTPNTTDADGKRYRFGRQPEIARWNLERLADALNTLLPEGENLSPELKHFDTRYFAEFSSALAGKFGFMHWQDGDETIVNTCFDLMKRAEVDMTLFFTQLAELDIKQPDTEILRIAFYSDDSYQQYAQDFLAWLTNYITRLQQDAETTESRIRRMQQFNPRYVLRNYLAQEAIDLAEQGDFSRIHTLLQVLRKPYEKQDGREQFSEKRPDWARNKAGCSMLSCSS
ncbi:MAG: YdiU family protein [Methylophilaceae bacterium]|nr:YdiU family protein [Methylophilaceae bacterium]